MAPAYLTGNEGPGILSRETSSTAQLIPGPKPPT